MRDQENTRRGENSTMRNSPPKRSRFSIVRYQFEIDIELNPYDYEAWHENIDFERNGGNIERIRKVFDNAVEYIPRETTKHSWWPHYVYLWLKYALFEEIEARDAERARSVYSRCLQLIPHRKFSFEKVWISAAEFEIRQSNYENARNILESAIEMAPTANIFKIYIDMNRQLLGDIKACRELYRRCVQCAPDDDYSSWMDYIEFEKSQSNPDIVRFIYDIAISLPALRDSAQLWCSYIDFEILEDDPGRARDLFEKLLEQNKQVGVWIKYARFEASIAVDRLKEEEAIIYNKKKRVIFAETYIQKVREIFRKALRHFTASTRQNLEVHIRAKLLQEWEDLERSFGSLGNVNLVLDLVARFNRRNEGIILS